MKRGSEQMNIEEIFGVRVFDDAAMKKRLPKKAYESLSRTRLWGKLWTRRSRMWWPAP